MERLTDELLDLLKRINWAFYVEGTRKALEPVMSETKALIRKAEGRLIDQRDALTELQALRAENARLRQTLKNIQWHALNNYDYCEQNGKLSDCRTVYHSLMGPFRKIHEEAEEVLTYQQEGGERE